MDTSSLTPTRLRSSVIAVPPLARDRDENISVPENRRMIQHLEAGGISILLYGGNAVFYHLAPSQYGRVLQMLSDEVADSTLVIPSIGPSFGMMMDQVEILRDTAFPTAMVLPQQEIVSSSGVSTGIRRAAEKLDRPIVLYLKHSGIIAPADVHALFRDGCVACIKYAVVLDNPADDPYLDSILEGVPADSIVSGMGEQPAIVHLRQFGLAGFTSGCVCIAPRLSQSMLHAAQAGDWERAEQIRQLFAELEDLRNQLSPIVVLHHAVAEAQLADTGPVTPLLAALEPNAIDRIRQAAQTLLAKDTQFAGNV